jgi:serine/threonine protein kinase
MEAIHASLLRYHGSLSSLTTTVDNLYSVKICAAGSSRILHTLTDDRCPLTNAPLDLWLAPEMLKDVNHQGSKEADMYALGIVICEILAGNTVVVDLDSADATFGKWSAN